MNNYYKDPKPALLIIDMLNAYFDEGGLLFQSKQRLVQNINEIVDYAHKIEVPVIWIRQEYKRDLSDAPLSNKKSGKLPNTIAGEQNSQLLKDLHKQETDLMLVKKRYSPFFGTDLEQILRKLNINTLIIAGVNSMTCVRVAVNDAYQLDFEVILALDCIDGYDKEQHLAAIKYMQYSQSTGMKNKEIIEELQRIKDSKIFGMP
jgi:nicotinamidase-related amidase